MPLSADSLREHIVYSAWASTRLVRAAAALSPEELTHDFKTADNSVLGTLAHVFAADRVWLARLQGGLMPEFISDTDRQLSVLENEWPQLQERWQRWATTVTDQSAQRIVDYKDLRGRPWRQPLWQLVLHAVNHATHHRGQVSGFLRTLGHTPPSVDLITYYRENV